MKKKGKIRRFLGFVPRLIIGVFLILIVASIMENTIFSEPPTKDGYLKIHVNDNITIEQKIGHNDALHYCIDHNSLGDQPNSTIQCRGIPMSCGNYNCECWL
jgi:hypothetical protein